MTSQNIDLSSWDTLYMYIVSYIFRLFNVDVAVREGRRQLGRYGCRGEDNIEMGFKDMECWCCLGLSGPE